MIELFDYQKEAVSKMRNGCILNGRVGSGKSCTSLAYYYIQNGGVMAGADSKPMKNPLNLYIITTARKRDSHEWEGELSNFGMSTNPDISMYKKHKIYIDSWNNIKKYKSVRNSFFIFDEQRVVGNGTWAKTFIKIAKNNKWILLSATPGDTWTDYVPVFLANGFFKNVTEFNHNHCIFNPHVNYPQVERYINVERLIRLRDRILIDMNYSNPAKKHHEDIYVEYDKTAYRELMRNRWDPWKNEPIETATSFCYAQRRLVNSSEYRAAALLELLEKHPKAIIFYNFDYELDILKSLYYGEDVIVSEWNGHKHQPLPEGDKWIYLVQYNAGAEGWNCIKTDTIIFYSQNYSWKTVEQASGRIDRLNTPFNDLYYYHLKTHANIDLAISKALLTKKKFNETKYYKSYERSDT